MLSSSFIKFSTNASVRRHVMVNSGMRVSFSSGGVAPSLLDMRLNKMPPTGTQTKVVCTIGPATDTASTVGDLVEHGMHVARLNFSHAGSDYSYPEANMGLVRNAAGKHFALKTGSALRGNEADAGMPPLRELPNNLRAILVDTKGPEIRTGPLQGDADIAEIQMGATVELTLEDVSSDTTPATPADDSDLVTHRIQVDYMSICTTVKVGKQILLDDGLIALEVTSIDPSKRFVTCLALNGGPIKKNKGVNLPGMELDLPALTEKDKRDLKWACEVGADFVAASFIRTGANVRSVIAYLNRCIASLPDTPEGTKPLRPLVISKIENKEGMDHFDEILEE
jgi:pyruvate kinase